MITNGASPQLLNNKIHHGLSAGVLIRDGAKPKLEQNDIFENKEPGVAIEAGAEPLLMHNLIHEGKYGGVVCFNGGRGNICDNEIWGEQWAFVATAWADRSKRLFLHALFLAVCYLCLPAYYRVAPTSKEMEKRGCVLVVAGPPFQ